MSAAPVLPDPTRDGAAVGRSTRRGHLRLVGSGEGGADGVSGEAPLRVTRRGRLLITLTVVASLVVLVAVLTTVGATGAPGPEQTVTVQSGQTLSEVAATNLPGLSINDAVVELQLANDLSSLHVHAGQELVIPAR